MNIVKLHASGSTNDDLKVRYRDSELPNLTTLVTHNQLSGKGQRGAKWESEPFKNLTFSILITDLSRFTTAFDLQKFVAVVIVTWLKDYLNIHAKIKWPNDILSVNHKLAGVLIEKLFTASRSHHAIVGIGINVNQTEFVAAPRAISIKQITGTAIDLDDALISFVNHFEKCFLHLQDTDKQYLTHFFKLGQPAQFTKDNVPFTAIVKGIDDAGKLILSEGDLKSVHDLKEITWNY